MRTLILVTALVSLLSPLSAQAEILAVCGDAVALKVGYAGVLGVSGPDIAGAQAVPPLALSRDAKGFDVMLNWGERDQHSLRAEGADIVANDLGGLIHLLVVRPATKSLEHFVFSLDDDSGGDLIWDAPGGAAGSDNEIVMACTKPKG